jgi:hypothetical protein
MLHRRGVDRFDAHRRVVQPRFEIAPGDIRRTASELLRRVEEALGALKVECRRLLLVRQRPTASQSW